MTDVHYWKKTNLSNTIHTLQVQMNMHNIRQVQKEYRSMSQVPCHAHDAQAKPIQVKDKEMPHAQRNAM